MTKTAVCALLAAVAVLTNLSLMAAAVGLDVARLFAFSKLHDVDATGARLLVASTIADAAFYLLCVPVSIGLARALSSPRSQVGGSTGATGAPTAQIVGAVGYAVSGAAGALLLTTQWPGLFARAAAGDVDAVARFEIITTFVFRTLWHQIGSASGALWWFAVAVAARRDGRAALAAVSAALAVASGVELIVTSAHFDALASAVLTMNLSLLPLWAIVAALTLSTRVPMFR